MRKLMTAVSFAALALIGINAGNAKTDVQLADTRYEYPTNNGESDVNLRGIGQSADIRYDFPADELDSDNALPMENADIRYDFPADELDSDDQTLIQSADVSYDFPADEIDGDHPELRVPGSLA